MTHRAVDIPFLYDFSFHPLRGTKEKSIVASDVVKAEIREASFTEAPMRLHAIADSRRYIGREFEGQFYLPASHKGIPLERREPMGFPGFGMDGRMTLDLLFPGRQQAAMVHLKRRDVTERPTGVSRVVMDGHGSAREAVLAGASKLLFVEGGLYRQSPPPKFALERRVESHWLTMLDDGNDWYPRAYSFALDRMDEIRDFRDRVQERGGVKVAPLSNVEIILSDWPMFDVPEIHVNAACAALHVLASIGNELHHYPPEMIRIAMEISKARGGEFGLPAKDPTTIRYLLEELREAIPKGDGLWLRRHIANGIDAIEMSRDFDRAPLAAEDIDALEGFAP